MRLHVIEHEVIEFVTLVEYPLAQDSSTSRPRPELGIKPFVCSGSNVPEDTCQVVSEEVCSIHLVPSFRPRTTLLHIDEVYP